MSLLISRLASPVGELTLAVHQGRLALCEFSDAEARVEPVLARRFPADIERVEAADPIGAARALERYFAGELTAIDHLPTAAGGTPFQEAVWAALRLIPAGHTDSYGALAARLGQPGASRAVGLANGANPIAIIVPCHRVIGANGALTGYGGGIERKRWLLEHEARHGRRGDLFG